MPTLVPTIQTFVTPGIAVWSTERAA